MRKGIDKICPECNVEFYVQPSHIARRTYCSHSCQLTGNKLRAGHRPINAFKTGELVGAKNFKWRGDYVGYPALHDWVARALGRPRKCENCGTVEAVRYEWANLSGEYRRDTGDWARLCKMCHALIDNSARGLMYN